MSPTDTSRAVSILIANHNTAAFLAVSLRAIHALTTNPFTVLVNDDGSDSADLTALHTLERNYPDVHVWHRPSRAGGSTAHGEALDFLMSHVETPYTAVLDADCTPLMRSWDDYLINRLDEQTRIIGSRLGEGWSGNKPIDFPLPFLVLFDTGTYRDLGISALPENPSAGRDTCWQWRPKYLGAGYRGETLKSVNTRLTPVPPFDNVQCAVYYTHEGCLIGSHFGRGSNPAGKRPAHHRFLKSLARRALAEPDETSVSNQRERWLQTCREVIDAAAD